MIFLNEDAAAALLHYNNHIIKHKQKMTKRQLLFGEISIIECAVTFKKCIS